MNINAQLPLMEFVEMFGETVRNAEVTARNARKENTMKNYQMWQII